MSFHGSPFQGDVKNGRMEGTGEYTFSDGNKYKGELKDGQFHGQGTLWFVDGGKFDGQWELGKAIKGIYTFPDGLVYSETNWDYGTPADRRFFHERVNGLTAEGNTCSCPPQEGSGTLKSK